jgi:hypothetical protein
VEEFCEIFISLCEVVVGAVRGIYILDWRLVNLKRCYFNSISKPSRYRQFLSVASGLFFNECGESFLGEGIFWEIVLVS